MKQPIPNYSISMEQELKRYLRLNNTPFLDGSRSYKALDFTIELPERRFALDVKEKRQHYQTKNWPSSLPEQDMFVIDELAIRKCLAYSPFSGILVRDNLQQRYVLYPVVDLALMPRTRLNRPIEKNQLTYKGKWIIDLRNGLQSSTLDETVRKIRQYIVQVPIVFSETLECYGHYVGEEIGQGGITRRPYHWDTDVHSTR